MDTNVFAVEVDNLRYQYGPRRALDGVSFGVEPGELCGVLGPNGSGKSTLFRILTTLMRPQGGAARVLGFDLAGQPREVRARIGAVFQSPSLDKRLTTAENLRHHGHLYGLHGAELEERIAEMLARVQMRERTDDFVGTLSGGQQRRVELAKGLLHRPRVLILDEPSTGLDPAARRTFREQLRRHVEEDDITVLLTTHFMEEADACDRLVVLDEGRVVDAGPPEALKGQVAGDCVVVRAPRPDELSGRIEHRLGVCVARVGDTLRIEQPRGHEIVAKLVEAFGDEIESVTLARPTLEDFFIDRTGHRLEDRA